MPAFDADPDEVARMALASAGPAQEALSVAFAQAATNVRLLGRRPTSTTS